MKQQSPSKIARAPRADAVRNRERILEAAKVAFSRDGASTSLDDIARQSGIGSGTLYRHFPTRHALIEAVYRTEVEKLANAAQSFAAALPPIEALRAWMHLFVDHVAGKLLIVPAMDTVPGGAKRLIMDSRGLIHAAFTSLAERAIANGDLRYDLNPDDFYRTLVGIFHSTNEIGWVETAHRITDILIAGSRPGSK